MSYYFQKRVPMDFQQAIERVTEALKQEGFGILTEIDIRSKMKEKLGVEFHDYRILGACHPPSAYEALQREDKIGTMLPCNVIVQAKGSGESEVAAVDPVASMQAVKNPALEEVARGVQERLRKVVESL
jgi:uncharacterized protein (DUF302 family)